MKKTILEYQSNNSILGSKFEFTDAHHIVFVSNCERLNKVDWISSTDNGINLEPNIHRLIHKRKLFWTKDYKLADESGNIIYEIEESWLTNERKKFITRAASLQ